MNDWSDEDWEKDRKARKAIKFQLFKVRVNNIAASFMVIAVVLFIVVIGILKLLQLLFGG